MIRSKSFVIERADDFIRWLLLNTKTDSGFASWLPRCMLFSPSFILTSPKCLASRKESQELLVLRTSHRRTACGVQLSPIVFMSVVWTFGDTLQRSRNKMQVHEKMCCLLGFTPNLYLTHNDRYFGVKLAARLERGKCNRQIMTKVFFKS